jgi:hypothetical protein
MPTIGELPPTRLDLDVFGWSQCLSTKKPSTVLYEAAKCNGSRAIRIPGLGNIMELPFLITFGQNAPEEDTYLMPVDSIGYVSPQESDAHSGAFVACNIRLPEGCFAELWQRLRARHGLAPTISVNVAPISREAGDSLVWDRAESKFLFVASVDFRFGRAPVDRGASGSTKEKSSTARLRAQRRSLPLVAAGIVRV